MFNRDHRSGGGLISIAQRAKQDMKLANVSEVSILDERSEFVDRKTCMDLIYSLKGGDNINR